MTVKDRVESEVDELMTLRDELKTSATRRRWWSPRSGPDTRSCATCSTRGESEGFAARPARAKTGGARVVGRDSSILAWPVEPGEVAFGVDLEPRRFG
jgi:hypothetical protein